MCCIIWYNVITRKCDFFKIYATPVREAIVPLADAFHQKFTQRSIRSSGHGLATPCSAQGNRAQDLTALPFQADGKPRDGFAYAQADDKTYLLLTIGPCFA